MAGGGSLVPHTGVVAFGEEVFFGIQSGIQRVSHKAFESQHGRPVQEIDKGCTTVSKADFDAFLETIAHRYTSTTYDLIKMNCNNFSNEVV